MDFLARGRPCSRGTRTAGTLQRSSLSIRTNRRIRSFTTVQSRSTHSIVSQTSRCACLYMIIYNSNDTWLLYAFGTADVILAAYAADRYSAFLCQKTNRIGSGPKTYQTHPIDMFRFDIWMLPIYIHGRQFFNTFTTGTRENSFQVNAYYFTPILMFRCRG